MSGLFVLETNSTIGYFIIVVFLPAALRSGVYSSSNRNEYPKHKLIMFLGSKVQWVHRDDNLTAICELTV
jgi:hypothetical protein